VSPAPGKKPRRPRRRGGTLWTSWPVLKDVFLTAMGCAVILYEILLPVPNITVVGAGLALCGVVASLHLWTLLDLSFSRFVPGKKAGKKPSE
jgi:hypothetical protein